MLLSSMKSFGSLLDSPCFMLQERKSNNIGFLWADTLTKSRRHPLKLQNTSHANRIAFVIFMHFVRRIYPKGLPVKLRFCTFDQSMFSLGIRPMTSVLLLAPSVARYYHESFDISDMSCDVTLHLHLIVNNTIKGDKS